MAAKLALHERLELQEILTLKNITLTKASTMQGLAGCKELKSILAAETNKGKQHVEQLAELLKEREVSS
ncbi:hypothetical protein SAMN05192534_10967 [Alteribacillus persepolensis]|uniref:Spore coat protein n=1 Tax=Alteribacillus persepolensis TaxID=568899 RepID=A0A1G8EF13_9BACI|nr:hypothetical protein [Alteribacillus persepolensis]SDH68478.1 hypothetical protein SAMN05192534_10967 [Alteribacillus persepolensis]